LKRTCTVNCKLSYQERISLKCTEKCVIGGNVNYGNNLGAGAIRTFGELACRSGMTLFPFVTLGGVFLSFIGIDVGSPESKVITEELHDERGILVAFFVKGVQLCNGIVEGLLSNLAGLLGLVHDFIVKYGEIQSKTKTNWVCRLELSSADVSGTLVSIQTALSNIITVSGGGDFSEVPVIITLHFIVEHLRISILGTGNESLIQQ